MAYTKSKSHRPPQPYSEPPHSGPYATHHDQGVTQPFANSNARHCQPSVEDEIESYWKSQLLSDLNVDEDHDGNGDYLKTYMSDYNQQYPTDAGPYSYQQPMTSYAETIYDDSSVKTSLSSSPQIPYVSIPWQDSVEDIRCTENWTDPDFRYTQLADRNQPLPNLSKPWPDFDNYPPLPELDDATTIDPYHLHCEPRTAARPQKPTRPPTQPTPIIPTPQLCSSSPLIGHSPSPSPPLPPPLQSPNSHDPHSTKPPLSSFQETLTREILRRHRADAAINSNSSTIRSGKRKADALIEENAKRMEWAKEMLLTFPRESSTVFTAGRCMPTMAAASANPFAEPRG